MLFNNQSDHVYEYLETTLKLLVKSDEYVRKTVETVKEAAKLIEAGFDYVCEIDGIKLFRKRK